MKIFMSLIKYLKYYNSNLKSSVPSSTLSCASKIKAEMVLHFAENDPRINVSWPAFEAGLKAQGTAHAAHHYVGTQHGFHNNSTPRYQQAAADLSWARTLALFQKTLKA